MKNKRAIGISDKSIMKIVMYETVMISIIGGSFGAGLGFSGRNALNVATRSLFGIDIVSSINPVIIIAAFSTSVVAGVVSGVIPALLGRRDNIAKVLGD
jgi:ABC-type antimicrobial peptide transport system permease subunit